jgi:hypothetical protein
MCPISVGKCYRIRAIKCKLLRFGTERGLVSGVNEGHRPVLCEQAEEAHQCSTPHVPGGGGDAM